MIRMKNATLMTSRHLIQIIDKVQKVLKRQGMIKKYSQPCVQRPPYRPQNSTHGTQVVVNSSLAV